MKKKVLIIKGINSINNLSELQKNYDLTIEETTWNAIEIIKDKKYDIVLIALEHQNHSNPLLSMKDDHIFGADLVLGALRYQCSKKIGLLTAKSIDSVDHTLLNNLFGYIHNDHIIKLGDIDVLIGGYAINKNKMFNSIIDWEYYLNLLSTN